MRLIPKTKFEMEMKFNPSPFIWLLIIQSLAVLGVSQDHDFFYLVQQWPGSYGGPQHNICYPTTGKPAQSFIIGGFRPSFNNGSIPTYCDPNNPFNETKVSGIIDDLQKYWPSLACPSSNGTQLWAEEWEKHGTCSQSVLDQYNYFFRATGLIQILRDVHEFLQDYGIRPDGTAHNLNTLKYYLRQSFLGGNVGIECNEDASGNSQFYQIHICIHPSGKFMIKCPKLPAENCAESVVFPSF